MSDARWTWGSRYILLRQDSSAESPQRVGMPVAQGWAAYARDGHLFVKTFGYQPQANYPDFGSAAEIFTNNVMLEVETFGPLTRLEPGDTVEHEEHWHLFADVPMPENERQVEQDVWPKVAKVLG